MLKKFNVRTICSYPEWIRGQPLLSLPANNFTCGKIYSLETQMHINKIVKIIIQMIYQNLD